MSPREEDFFFATVRQLEHASATDKLSKAYQYASEAERNAWFDMTKFLLAAPERVNKVLPLLGDVTVFARLSKSLEGRGIILAHEELVRQLTVALTADDLKQYTANLHSKTADNFYIMLEKVSDSVLSENDTLAEIVAAYIGSRLPLPLSLFDRVSSDVLHFKWRDKPSVAWQLLECGGILKQHPAILNKISREAKEAYVKKQGRIGVSDLHLQYLIDIPSVFAYALRSETAIKILKANHAWLNKLTPDCIDASVVSELLKSASTRELVSVSEHLQCLMVPHLQRDETLLRPILSEDKSGLLAKLMVAGLKYEPTRVTEKPAARQPPPSFLNRLAGCVSGGVSTTATGDYIPLSDGSAAAKKNN